MLAVSLEQLSVQLSAEHWVLVSATPTAEGLSALQSEERLVSLLVMLNLDLV